MEYERPIKQIKIVFTAIVRKLIDPAFRFPDGGAIQRMLSKFIDLINKNYGNVSEERLVDICVALAYRFKDNKWTVKTVFSESSLRYFIERKTGGKYYENKWLETEDLTRNVLLDMIVDRREHPHAKYIYMQSEEGTKKRFLGTEVGFILCQASTLGWCPESPTCSQCPFTSRCETETNRKYPEIYRLRKQKWQSKHTRHS